MCQQYIYKVLKILFKKIIKTTSREIQRQHWIVNIKLSMEVIASEYFSNSIYPGRNEKNRILFIYKQWKWTRLIWLPCSYVETI